MNPPLYKVIIKRAATKYLALLGKADQQRIAAAIDKLAINPRPVGCCKLTEHDDRWRIRVGDHRVVYEVIDKDLVVTVIVAGHRRDVYRRH